MSARRDLMSECNDQGMPLDAFAASWCSRCLNLECTRSIAGKSKFEARVSSWEERLFLNPPTMNAVDPRFAAITAQKFITIDVGRIPEVTSSWVDPSDLEEPDPQPAPVPQVYVAQPVSVSSTPTRTPSIQNDKPSTRSVVEISPLLLGNAPDQSGKILPGPHSSSILTPTKRDPWAAPEPPDPADQLILPGGKVKFRGSGV